MQVNYIDLSFEQVTYNRDLTMISALYYIYPSLRTWGTHDWRGNTLLAIL